MNYKLEFTMVVATGIQILFHKFHEILGKLPTKDYGYGIVHFRVQRGGKGVVIQDC